ncbi:hypothetical protein EYC80_006747 [Monilinia laxa]|uniref:Uncharacterized protein n=1 Tax=Monilinia laxa TaxID=61186 RepID=A0A5N6JZ14_MONLA|nr:hypothetical protein EYC80_006747 [Monilinia laxa]
MPARHIVLPAALATLVISLTGLFIGIGRWPNFLLDFPVISLDTTLLKVKFLPANIIHLQLSKLSSSEPIQLSAYNFAHQLGEIQKKFAISYNEELHIAFLIYVSALCFGGIIIFLAFVSYWNDKVSWIAGVFSILTAIFLLIGNSIITTFQTQAVKAINKYGGDIGIMGYRGTGLLVLIWTVFAVAFVAAVAWGWGAWINGRDDSSIQGSNHGGVYIQCHRDPGETELARLVNLEVNREGTEGR